MMTGAQAFILALVLGSAGWLHSGGAFAQTAAGRSDSASRQARHTANFPGKPIESVKESKLPSGQTVATHLLDLRISDRYYGTAWTLVPEVPSTPGAQAQMLEVAAAEALKASPGGTMHSKQKVTVGGINGLDFVIDKAQTKARTRHQVFIVSGVLVEQTYSGPAGTETGREAGQFFNSLKLLP